MRGILSGLLRYNIGGYRNFYSYQRKQDETLLSGYEKLINFSDSFSIGASVELLIMYEIKNRIGVGLGMNNILYLNFSNGVTTEIRRYLGLNEQLLEGVKINHYEKESRLSKHLSFSINLSYII